MATSLVDIYNMALGAVGTKSRVSLPTERSREADACNLYYERVRDQVQRAASWSCCEAYYRMPVLSERDDAVAWAPGAPKPGFRFAYGLPSDLLWPRNLVSFNYFSLGLRQNGNDDQKVLFAQEEQAILCYSKRQPKIDLWDSQLIMATTFALAAYIARPLTGKDSAQKNAIQQANDTITSARISSANEGQMNFDSLPEWITARGYAGTVPQSQYTYPVAPMINFGASNGE